MKYKYINFFLGKDYPEVLEKVKYSTISWTLDNKGIFYACYPDRSGKTDGSETVSNRNHKLFYHVVNTPQNQDVLVAEFPDEPLWRMWVLTSYSYCIVNPVVLLKWLFCSGTEVSDCGKYLIVSTIMDCRDNLLFYADLTDTPKIESKLKLKQFVFKFEADYEVRFILI